MAGWNLPRIRPLAGLIAGLPSHPWKKPPDVFFTAGWTDAWSVRHNHQECGCCRER